MGEYEPRDSRNVTGTASSPDGRWTNTQGKPPLAGEPTVDEDEDAADDADDPVIFEPEDALLRKIRDGLQDN